LITSSNGFIYNLKEVISKVRFIQGDIRSTDTCSNACRNMDIVFHLAAKGSVSRSIENPRETNDVNVNGLINMLSSSRDCNVSKFIFASSSSVHSCMNPYAASKIAGESYCSTFSLTQNIPAVSLRYFNVYGTRQRGDSEYSAVIPRFISALKQNVSPEIYGTGSQTRDFTYVDDIVEANILAMDYKGRCHAMDIGTGTQTSINTLCHIVFDGSKVQPIYKDSRPGDPSYSVADIMKAEVLLGFKSKVNIKEGIKKTIQRGR